MKFDEPYEGYCVDINGNYGEPIDIDTTDDFKNFIFENVEKHHELRVTDIDGRLVYHIVKQSLLFTINTHTFHENHWDSSLKKFVKNS